MSIRIPTTQEITDQNIARLEAALNQTTPDTDKAFNKVLAAMEAMNSAGLYRFAIERAKQNLALTANEDGLTVLGDEYGVQRKPARAAQLDIQTAANPATSLPITASLTGDPNSEKYSPNATYNEAGGVIDATVTADTPGIAGNLNVSDTMTLDEPIAGVGNTWTVQAVAVLGVDQEDLESWRRRILLEIQTVGGGGNGVDYRRWAEETPGVYRAFPYAGVPADHWPPFLDGDMEETGVTDWTAGNSATLTKQTSGPQAGLRLLRVAYNAVNNPYAYQTVLVPFKQYRIVGYARSDGSKTPRVATNISTVWTGTTSTNWQQFDETFFVSGSEDEIRFINLATSAGYCEFDSVVIIQTSEPGDRTVFIEADSSIDPDGIAPLALLTSARSYINTDPITGKTRPPLGETNETLYIYSIYRTIFNIEVRDLVVDGDIEAETKDKIELAVDNYLRGIAPFIEGTDPPASQNDMITDLTLSQVIQDILNPVVGSAGGIGLYLYPGVFIPSYALGQGELAKLGSIIYV